MRLLFSAVLLLALWGRAEARAQGPTPLPGRPTAVVAATPTAGHPPGAAGRVEARPGRRSRVLAGAGVGLLVGTGAALAILYSGDSNSLCDRSRNQDAMSRSECLGLTAAGGLAGAGLGAVAGALLPRERRQDVPPGRLRLGLQPQAGRVSIALGAAF